LLLFDGYETHNLPKTGERQYGVDVLANKEDKVFLFVLKQQNISRRTWDSDPDSVRQSLNDIFDVYLPSILPTNWKEKDINIVVATNGYLADAVRISWEGFQRSHISANDIKILYDFWDIDKFVSLCDQHAFNEHLFGKSLHSDLRKVLYFMDESDFKYDYFEKIIDVYIDQINEVYGNSNRFKKRISAMHMCVSLIGQWAYDKKNFKVAISVLEYTLIKYWAFLKGNQLLGMEKYIEWLHRFLKQYEKFNVFFLKEIQTVCDVEYGIPYYNPLEHRILLYEVIGRLCSYGIYLFFKYLFRKNDMRQVNTIVNTLILLLKNNPDFKYPIYDNQIIELYMLLLLLLKSNKYSDLKLLLSTLVSAIECNYLHCHKYPAPSDQYDEALLIEMQEGGGAYEASALFGGLLEWICLIEDVERYNELVNFLKKDFPGLTCQTWQVNHNEEISLYNKNATYNAGVSVVLDLNLDIKRQKEILLNCNDTVQFEDFSFNEYSFPSLSIITSRYFNYPVLPQFWRGDIKKLDEKMETEVE